VAALAITTNIARPGAIARRIAGTTCIEETVVTDLLLSTENAVTAIRGYPWTTAVRVTIATSRRESIIT
jgi:hypothetical protein